MKQQLELFLLFIFIGKSYLLMLIVMDERTIVYQLSRYQITKYTQRLDFIFNFDHLITVYMFVVHILHILHRFISIVENYLVLSSLV